jgi:hypothetical protein
MSGGLGQVERKIKGQDRNDRCRAVAVSGAARLAAIIRGINGVLAAPVRSFSD